MPRTHRSVPPPLTRRSHSWLPASTASPALDPVSPDRSLAWILAPGRTAAGHAMLVQRRHVNLFGPGQLYEVHVHSEDGWHARGTALLGTPVPMSGQNEHLAWATTPGSADFADVYELTFDHPTDPLMYRYESGWRRAEQWSDTIFVNTPHGVEPRRYTFLRTDHGPVVARSADRAYAVSIARMREGGALQQSYAMSRAATLDGFNDALEQRSLVATNTLVADREGNIQIVYGGAVPRRDPSFDWSRPVDGSIARTGWDGYQALQDLPQSRNPRGGWLASTADSTDPRIATVRRVLESDSVWTFDAVAASAFDTHVGIAGPTTAPLVREWEDIGGTNPARAMPVDDALDTLRLWDRISTIESTAMSLFVYWQEQLHTMGESRAAYRHFLAFESALERLAREHGARLVPWGDVMRLQRVRPRDGTPFSDDQPSLPLAGGPAWTGIIFDAESWQPPGLKHRYATSTSWIGVYELSPDSRARSIAVFGTSPDPASPHYMDQAALFARGELKTAWFSRDDVTASARRTYRPAPVDAIR